MTRAAKHTLFGVFVGGLLSVTASGAPAQSIPPSGSQELVPIQWTLSPRSGDGAAAPIERPGPALRVEEGEAPSQIGDPDETGTDATPHVAAALRPTPAAAQWSRVTRPAPSLTDALTPKVAVVQSRNRAGVPWIIAGAALVVGGAVVGDDVGTVLMVGGVLATSYGLFIYF